MRIGISIVESGKRLNIEIPSDTLCTELVEELLDLQIIKTPADHSRYLLCFKDKMYHAELHMDQSLCANGVEEGDVLSIFIGAGTGDCG